MPWAELLAAALRVGVAPAAFWQLSIAEWNMIMGGLREGARPLSHAEFKALAARFPDLPKEN